MSGHQQTEERKSARWDLPKHRAKKFEVGGFGLIRRKGEDIVVYITRIEGKDVYYRPVRTHDGALGSESVADHRLDGFRPAPAGHYRIFVEFVHTKRESKDTVFEVSLPQPDGTFKATGETFTALSTGIDHVRKKWGADTRGRIRLLNEIKKG